LRISLAGYQMNSVMPLNFGTVLLCGPVALTALGLALTASFCWTVEPPFRSLGCMPVILMLLPRL
jgi:hypothetical protein